MIRGFILTAFITVFASVAPASPVQGMESLFYNELFHLDELESSGSGMFWDDMYTDSEFNKVFIPDSGVLDKDRWSLYPWVSGGLSSSRYITDKNVFGGVGLTNDIKFRRLFIRQTLDVDTRYKNDTDYVWKKDRVAAGRIEEAYFQLDLPYSFIRLGRLKRNWGPFPERSLILSSNPHTYDALEWKLESSFFEFRHLFTVFSYRGSTADIDPAPNDRYLTAHSLNFMIGDWAVLGLTESVLFNRDGLPDLQYVNPFSIYTVTNTNAEGKGNLMLGLNWSIKPPFYKKIAFKGELVFDDFQVDNEDKGDQEPTHWGIDMGLYAHDFLPINRRHALYTEYKYLSRWIYTVSDANMKEGGRYMYLGKSLGARDNDYDMFKIGTDIYGKDFWIVSLGLSYRRKGANSIMTLWNDNERSSSLGYRDETPLSERDTLTRSIDFSIGGKFYFKGYIGLHAEFNNIWERTRGESWSYSPEIEVSLSTRYGFDLLFEKIKDDVNIGG